MLSTAAAVMLEGMSRTDYYHDPSAPPANSLVPSTTAAVRDGDGRLLLIHRVDNDFWALPGSGMELGESIADAAVREVEEETGLAVELTGPAAVADLAVHPSMRRRIDDALAGGLVPQIG